MPLPETTNRKLAHTRVVTCKGYEREDGLWDIEGEIIDTKPFPIPNKDRGGAIKPGEPLHGMSIRLTIDREMLVHDAQCNIDYVPFHYCNQTAEVIKQLIGLRIASGWTQKTKEIMGGTKGCTHLLELLGPIATTAFQTIVTAENKYDPATSHQLKEAPGFLDKCFTLSAKSPVVQEHWPQFYRKEN